METEYAFLADAAQVSEGKLYVLGGGIDNIWSPEFPATHRAMSLVIKLRLHPTECNRPHKLEVYLWDSDGKRLGEMGGDFSLPLAADAPARPGMVQMVFNIVGQQFPRPGDYAFHIVVDGQHIKTIPLHLQQTRKPGPA